ncbi:hypothetical protein DPMN_166156 [Dreissena polymorpha]|uniref:Uncharacterized protein n=1 Tax=Dreissena polymorpha TaxID=45954 RepID=A0A9D4IXM6_DREPO|nr:hypothetical protein DPMN_166156 [Dreissena polymorpha]
MNRESPARTGKDQRGNGNERDGIVAPPGPMQTSSLLRQRPGECRHSPGIATVHKLTGIHRDSTGVLPATTGVKPGCCRSVDGV